MKRKMKKAVMRKLLIFATIWFVLLSIVPFSVLGANEPSIYLYFNGNSDRYLNVTIGDSFNFSEYVDQDGDNLQGAKMTINFTTHINITEGEEGPNNIWGSSFLTVGSITNDTGDGTGSVNYTQNGLSCETSDGEIIRFNATAYSVGTATINWTYVELTDCDVNVLDYFMYNSTVYVHPAYPATDLSLNQKGLTYINLSWTQGLPNGASQFVLYNQSNNSVLYNGTNTYYNHTSLGSGTTYHYSLYTYNATENLFSLTNQTHTETTDTSNASPSLSHEGPNNNTKLSYRNSVTLEIAIEDAEGDSLTGWILLPDMADNASISGGNGSYYNAITGMTAGTYRWWVNVTDGNTWTREYYNFTINDPPSGGGGGGGWEEDPVNSAPDVAINTALSVDVNDDDGDFVTVAFYWGNGTHIGNDTILGGVGIASVSPSSNLSFSTEYFWYVIANDTLDSTRGPSSGNWSFNTSAVNITMTTEWSINTTNNTVHKWINVTNNGAINLTNVVVWDRPHTNLSLSSYNHSGDFGANGHYQWEIPYLNISGTEHWYNISAWFSLSGQLANNTCIWNLVNISHLGETHSENLSGYCIKYSVSKEANRTFINESSNNVTWWINITNTGNFSLNNTYINETYFTGVNFTSSNISPTNSNQTFYVGNLSPGESFTLFINTSLNTSAVTNGTLIYNNITIESANTSLVTISEDISYGGSSTLIRITYDISLSDIGNVGQTVITIIGIMLIIGTIFLIVILLYKFEVIGGSGGQ